MPPLVARNSAPHAHEAGIWEVNQQKVLVCCEYRVCVCVCLCVIGWSHLIQILFLGQAGARTPPWIFSWSVVLIPTAAAWLQQ